MTIQHTTCGKIGAIKLIFPDDTRREITVGMLRDDPAGAAETLRRYVAAVAAVEVEKAVDAVAALCQRSLDKAIVDAQK